MDSLSIGKFFSNQSIKVAFTAGPFFEKKYEAVPHIFFTNKLPTDWSKA